MTDFWFRIKRGPSRYASPVLFQLIFSTKLFHTQQLLLLKIELAVVWKNEFSQLFPARCKFPETLSRAFLLQWSGYCQWIWRRRRLFVYGHVFIRYEREFCVRTFVSRSTYSWYKFDIIRGTNAKYSDNAMSSRSHKNKNKIPFHEPISEISSKAQKTLEVGSSDCQNCPCYSSGENQIFFTPISLRFCYAFVFFIIVIIFNNVT